MDFSNKWGYSLVTLTRTLSSQNTTPLSPGITQDQLQTWVVYQSRSTTSPTAEFKIFYKQGVNVKSTLFKYQSISTCYLMQFSKNIKTWSVFCHLVLCLFPRTNLLLRKNVNLKSRRAPMHQVKCISMFVPISLLDSTKKPINKLLHTSKWRDFN